MTDRGAEKSYALTEVRTVLSRAETAIKLLESGPTEWRYDVEWIDGERHSERITEYDPDHKDMIFALRAVVAQLERWRRTGKGKRS